MFSKEVCQHCRSNSEREYAREWTEDDELFWENGVLQCEMPYYGTVLINLESVPEECPYKMEMMVMKGNEDES